MNLETGEKREIRLTCDVYLVDKAKSGMRSGELGKVSKEENVKLKDANGWIQPTSNKSEVKRDRRVLKKEGEKTPQLWENAKHYIRVS